MTDHRDLDETLADPGMTIPGARAAAATRRRRRHARRAMSAFSRPSISWPNAQPDDLSREAARTATPAWGLRHQT